MNMQDELRKLQSNPADFFKQEGIEAPAEILNDPQAMVMHLINSGKVSNPLMRMVMPMIQRMTGK